MYKQKMDEVNEYMTYKNLSSSLKKKVRNYFELKYRGKYFNEVAILKELNDSLRQVGGYVFFFFWFYQDVRVADRCGF